MRAALLAFALMLALHLLVPLVLGVVLHRVLARVEHLIEQLFFRRQFADERALRRLADESAYVEDPAALVARTLEDVATHARPARVALYRRTGAGYARAGQVGGPDWPPWVDADDRLFVALRAGPVEQLLAACRGALGDGGIAFPMPVAGRLHGALVCGERAEHFTRDECTILRAVAQQVGVALHALQAQADAALLEALVKGTVTLDAVRGCAEKATTQPAPLEPAPPAHPADAGAVRAGDSGIAGTA